MTQPYASTVPRADFRGAQAFLHGSACRSFPPLRAHACEVYEPQRVIESYETPVLPRRAMEINNQGKLVPSRMWGLPFSSRNPLASYLATLSSLKAWFDPTSDLYFSFSTGAQISAWVSRMGSLGAVTLAQATSASQPLRATAVSVLNNKNAVLLDGVDDFLQAATASHWTFFHNNTGSAIFTIERIDSTGLAIQYHCATCVNATANTGIFHSTSATASSMRVANGSGVSFLNNFAPAASSALYARDVSKWRVWTHGSGTANAYAAGGASFSQADTGGQVPSVAAPQLPFTLGRSNTASLSFKGYFGDIIILAEVPSSTVRNNITALLAQKWQVAA